jgi:hypothetical protein
MDSVQVTSNTLALERLQLFSKKTNFFRCHKWKIHTIRTALLKHGDYYQPCHALYAYYELRLDNHREN